MNAVAGAAASAVARVGLTVTALRPMIRAMPNVRPLLVASACFLALTAVLPAQTPQRGRALKIEDYYRIRTTGSPSISPDGRWVSFTVTTRVEDDKDSNKNASEGWFVPIDASAPPTRIEPQGGDVTNLRWLDNSRLQYAKDRQAWSLDPGNPSAAPVRVDTADTPRAGGRGRGTGPIAVPSRDGRWRAELRDRAQPQREPEQASDFEKRHQQRFEGAIFDWKDFQRDGQPFPAPDPRARPGQQLVVTDTDGTAARTLLDADIRPGGIAWHPDGTRLAYVADPDWRDELKYESPDLWTVTTDGVVTPDERRLRLQRPAVLTRRTISVVRAHVRHRPDHPAEAESRWSA